MCLLEWRDTPNSCGFSPREIFFALRIKTSLPVLPGKTSLDSTLAKKAAEAMKKNRTSDYRKRTSQLLGDLEIGSKVFIKEHDGRKCWIIRASVMGKTGPRG